MSERLLVIRMTPEVRDAVENPATVVEFWDAPTNEKTNRRAAVTFVTPTGKYWAVGPTTSRRGYGHRVKGIARRPDERWCWVLDRS